MKSKERKEKEKNLAKLLYFLVQKRVTFSTKFSSVTDVSFESDRCHFAVYDQSFKIEISDTQSKEDDNKIKRFSEKLGFSVEKDWNTGFVITDGKIRRMGGLISGSEVSNKAPLGYNVHSGLNRGDMDDI